MASSPDPSTCLRGYTDRQKRRDRAQLSAFSSLTAAGAPTTYSRTNVQARPAAAAAVLAWAFCEPRPPADNVSQTRLPPPSYYSNVGASSSRGIVAIIVSFRVEIFRRAPPYNRKEGGVGRSARAPSCRVPSGPAAPHICSRTPPDALTHIPAIGSIVTFGKRFRDLLESGLRPRHSDELPT
jgi:hypothetical protein